MGKKVVAKYKPEQIDKKNVAAFLQPVEVVVRSFGIYHIYRVKPLFSSPYYAIIFGDQPNLLKKIKNGVDNLYSIHHLLTSSSMYSYEVNLASGERITGVTIAEATVLARKPVPAE